MRIRVLAVLALLSSAPRAQEPEAPSLPAVRVFVLAGQSNMEGKAKVALLERQALAPETRERFARYVESVDEDGSVSFAERDDVWIQFHDRRGKLTVGYGSPGCVGPELAFGWTVGDRTDAPVLLIKTAWGGKSLYRDFRPPSAGLPEEAVLERDLAREQERDATRTIDDVRASYGAFYRAMIDDVEGTLAELGTRFPELAGRGHELAGFAWFQGWNDMISDEATAEYADNVAHLIRDVRRDLDAPTLPFVVGQLGVGGPGPQDAKREAFKAAQARPARLDEFRSNVALVKTDAFWDAAAQAAFDRGWKEHPEEWARVGSDFPYHYLGSQITMLGIGEALAEAALEIEGRR